MKTIITPSRPESPPPLRSDASLPLHIRDESTKPKPSQKPPNSEFIKQEEKRHSGIDPDSPVIRELTSSLTAAQKSVADLREQLASFNASIANSQAQLHISVEELRRKKKDDDADRADLKIKMRGLEENKRQAEGARREAEKKLKSVEAERDIILGRIDKMKREIAEFKHEMDDCSSAIRIARNETHEHEKTTREEMDASRREIAELEDLVAQDSHLNGELAAQVADAVDALQALINNSPQAPFVPYNREEHDEMARGSNPATPEVAQFQHNRLPASAPTPFPTNFRDPYSQAYAYPSGQPQRMSTQATASIMRDPAQQYRNNMTTLPPPAFRDLTGYEGFGPLGAPVESEIEEPGSPIGNMSSSFTANLLPQELFRSLEGDQTPSESRADLEDPWDTMEFQEPAQETAPHAPDDKWAPTPKAVSPAPAQQQAAGVSNDPSPEESRNSPALNAGLLHRAIQHMDHDTRSDAPRRWFSSSKLNALDASSPFSGYNSNDRHSTLGFPLAQTTSNESLPLPNAGYTNAFAPSAAEKKTLRWSSLGKWGNVNQGRQETPFANPSPFQPTEGAVGRSISAEHNAKYAWEHAVVEKEEPNSGERKSHRFFSLGRRGKEGESSGSWKS